VTGVVNVPRCIALNLEAAGYLAGWRPKAESLFVSALSDGRAGDEVAVRISLLGHPIRVTLFGTIQLVRRVGRMSMPPGVELKIDEVSLPSARFLAAVAQGEKVEYRDRPPRYLVGRRLRIARQGVERSHRTVNISEGRPWARSCRSGSATACSAPPASMRWSAGPGGAGPRATSACASSATGAPTASGGVSPTA